MGEVRIVAATQPVVKSGEKTMTLDEFLAYVARVSNPENQHNHLTAKKLLKYLVKHKHFSPFEMASITMEIVTTRDIARQILRHRSFSFQEFSQRYGVVTAFQTREPRLQDHKNRQNSIEIIIDDEETKHLREEWHNKLNDVMSLSSEVYQWALNKGIAKEQARVVLPEGLTESRLYMAGSIRSWIHYCQLRMANGTQKEHAEIAKQAWNLLLEYVPSLAEVLGEND